MFYNVKEMAKKGCFNLFKCGENYLLVYVTANSSVLVPIQANVKNFVAYIDVTDEDLEESLVDFVSKDLKALFNLPKKVMPKTKPMALTDYLSITERVRPIEGGMLSLKYLESLLIPEGFDTSALEKSLVISGNRDYSECLNDEEAVSLINSNKGVFNYFTPTLAGLPSDVRIAYEAIKQGKERFLMIVGPAGTGKTIVARQIAYLMNAPLAQTQCTEGTTPEDLVGKAVVNTDPTKAGDFDYIMGPLLKSYTKGWDYLLDEANMSLASCLNIINQFTDDTPEIIWDGKVYKKHPNFVLFMTMNAGYEGTNNINPALKSRATVIQIPALSQKEFVDRLKLYVVNKLKSSLSDNFYKELFKFNNYMITTSKAFAETVAFCIRNAQHLCSLILSKACSFEEFTLAVHAAYTNFLSMDNDNLEQLDVLKRDSDMISNIKKLYDEYDFKEVEEVSESQLFEDSEIMHVGSDEVASTTSSSSSKSSVDDLFAEDLDELDSFLNAAVTKPAAVTPDDEEDLD